LKPAASVRIADTYEDVLALLTDGLALQRSEGSQLQRADRRLLKRNARRLAEDKVDELIEAYLSGMSANAVAAQFGVHRTTVAAHLERRGMPAPHARKVMTPGLVERAVELRT
jgi:DNA invertase Pin-like site-specific DNA recombinase